MIHAITVMKDDKIKKVMCKSCYTTHVFREGSSETKTKRGPGRPRKSDSNTPVRKSRKKNWSKLVAEIDEGQLVNYDINGDYSEEQAIRHKQFGIGIITKVISDIKIEVLFQDEKKILAQNWE
jgi:ribosomal protein L21E